MKKESSPENINPLFKAFRSFSLVLREPVEYTLDRISAAGYKKGLGESAYIPISVFALGGAVGIISDSLAGAAIAGAGTWLYHGWVLRERWLQDYERT